jgi:hypothetical protein
MVARWFVPGLMGLLMFTVAAAADEPHAVNTANQFELKIGTELSSDYVDRGVTLSARRPSFGTDIEARFNSLYVRSEFNTVSLPTDPLGEFNFGGGFRHDFGPLRLDLGAEYSHYPRERMNGVPTDTDFWEASAIAIYQVVPGFDLNGMYAWSPNMAKSGAWSQYTEFGFATNVLGRFMPRGLDAEFSAGVGRFWFGNVAPETGGFRLPAHTTWNAGILFAVDRTALGGSQHTTFDLRAQGTNLSKENCFVFAGDPGATPGGAVDPVSNPRGLRSNWCGTSLAGTLRTQFDWQR